MSLARDGRGRFVRGSGSSRVEVRDHGAQALLARLATRAGGRVAVKVGIFDDGRKVDRNGMPQEATVVEVAQMNELGAPEANVPQRSFLGATCDAEESLILRNIRTTAADWVVGALSTDEAAATMGGDLVARVHATIDARVAPANAPATIREKGSDVPLIDTRQLYDAITWKPEDE